MPTAEEIHELVTSTLPAAFMAAQSKAEEDAIALMMDELQPQAVQNAINEFRAATFKFAKISSALVEAIEKISNAAGRKRLDAILTRFGKIHAEFTEPEVTPHSWESEDGSQDAPADEADDPPDPVKPTMPVPDKPPEEAPIKNPKPQDSKDFTRLADEYVTLFRGAAFRSNNAEREALRFGRTAAKNKAIYEKVGDPLGIPWWFVAAVHMLESSFNFATHLHNGDPLTARTRHVPKNRPKTGRPKFSWEESAIDALTLQKLGGLKDWSLARALHRWEAYNGFGYRKRRVPSPYLWSFTTVYSKGKFVRDGQFSANAVSKQCGAAALLKALVQLGNVTKLEIEGFAEGEGDDQLSKDIDPGPVSDGTAPNVDNTVPAAGGFEAFFAAKLADVTSFKWHEFLIKGSQNATSGLNTDPPEELWENVVPLARLLQRFRNEIGHPVVLTSVYRSPAYNNSVPGSAKRSQHMQFRAADFKVPASGNPKQWAARMRDLRKAGAFSGGIGTYNTFVHVDVRGYNADW